MESGRVCEVDVAHIEEEALCATLGMLSDFYNENN